MLRAAAWSVMMTIACLMFGSSAARAGGPTLEVVGAWGGPVNGIDIDGDIAYVAAGKRVVVLDIANPAAPVELAALDFPTVVTDVALRGDVLVAVMKERFTNGSMVFATIDVSEPSKPSVLWTPDGTLPSPFGFIRQARKIQLRGDYAYVHSDNLPFLTLFNIEDPTNVSLVGELYFGPRNPNVINDFEVVGDLLFTVSRSSGSSNPSLRIFDLSTPNPELPDWDDDLVPATVASVDLLSGVVTSPIRMSVVDQRAYVVIQEGGLEHVVIVDVTTPAEPTVLGSAGDLNRPHDVAAYQGYAYVAEFAEETSHVVANYGLFIFDAATDPSNPTLVDVIHTDGDVRALQVIGDRLYVFDDGEGLIIFDIASPAAPQRLGAYHSPAHLRRMASEGDVLFVTDKWYGMSALDISDPSRPTLVGKHLTNHNTPHGTGTGNWGIAVHDGVAYISAGYYGLEIVDVSDPSSPILLGDLPLNDTGQSRFSDVALSVDVPGYGLVAHIAYEKVVCPPVGPCGLARQFLNLNVTDPKAIAVIGDLIVTGSGFIRTIAMSESMHAHLGRDFGVPTTIDTSALEAPIVVHQAGHPSANQNDFLDVALHGDVLLMANGASGTNGGLFIRDVSDPVNPIDLTHVPGSHGEAVAVTGDLALVCGNFTSVNGQPVPGAVSKLLMFDLSRPEMPVLLDYVRNIGASRGAAILASEAFVFATAEDAGAHGVAILRIDTPSPTPADLNGDGLVNAADLAILLGSWSIPSGTPGCAGDTPCAADLNGDSFVNAADLAILLG